MVILHENIRQDKMTNTIFIVDGHLQNKAIKTITEFLETSQFSYFKYGKYIWLKLYNHALLWNFQISWEHMIQQSQPGTPAA